MGLRTLYRDGQDSRKVFPALLDQVNNVSVDTLVAWGTEATSGG